jgi:hypothetical protein
MIVTMVGPRIQSVLCVTNSAYAVNPMEANMSHLWKMLGSAIALAAVLSLTGAPARAQQGGGPQGGNVVPCSLAGVNPADHPAIFSNPEVARTQYGFVRGPDGNWTVIPDCRIGDNRN